jgi:hypothetical protein
LKFIELGKKFTIGQSQVSELLLSSYNTNSVGRYSLEQPSDQRGLLDNVLLRTNTQKTHTNYSGQETLANVISNKAM